MIGSEIVTKFNLYSGDTADLSTDEEYALLNKIYHGVLDEKDWEFLKKEYSGTTSGSVPYIALPSDFKNITVNYDDENGEPEQVVFVGPNFDKYKVIPFSQRRNYRDQDGYCYVDKRQSRLYFTIQLDGSLAVEFDYVYTPDDVTANESPVIDETHQDIIYHGMIMDFYAIDETEKGRSYYAEHAQSYQKFLTRMANINLKNSGLDSY